MSSASIPPPKPPELRSKSCETACSSNSSCFLQKRKPMNPLASPLRVGLARTAPMNPTKQRVLSAKLLRVKSLQNQLNDANFHLAEVMRENKALKHLQKRQDRALTKYEGTNAELPRLIKSHEEEIRFLTERGKQMRRTARELHELVKQRNDEVLALQEQLRQYEELDKDKRLLERGRLAEELDECRVRLARADGEVVTLNRRLAIETKTAKQRLNAEMSRHKQTQRELTNALSELMKAGRMIEAREGSGKGRGLPIRQSLSMVSLPNGKIDGEKVSDVKLEPLFKKPIKGILKSPSETIRARLSAGGKEAEPSAEVSRPNSSRKLDKIEQNLQNTIRRVEGNKESDEADHRIGDYCLKAISSVKSYNHVIENHEKNLEIAKSDTGLLLESIDEVDRLGLRLKKNRLVEEEEEEDGTNLDFVAHILSDELDFQKKYKDRNGNVGVGASEKKKLLATLRAIDNGDENGLEFASGGGGDERKKKLMTELFGEND